MSTVTPTFYYFFIILTCYISVASFIYNLCYVLLLGNHLNYSGIPKFMRKRSMLTVAQTTQNIWNFMVGKSSLQEIATLAIIQKISESNMETGKYGPKSGVSRIIWESWQQCLLDFEEELAMKSHDKTSSAVLCHGTVLLLGVFWGF